LSRRSPFAKAEAPARREFIVGGLARATRPAKEKTCFPPFNLLVKPGTFIASFISDLKPGWKFDQAQAIL
jgi:hypothetical protein